MRHIKDRLVQEMVQGHGPEEIMLGARESGETTRHCQKAVVCLGEEELTRVKFVVVEFSHAE